MQNLLWIVDRNDHDGLAPEGTVRELVIEGPSVGSGYLRDPKKTAEAFVQQPQWRSRFPASVEGGFYKSGDLLRYGPDGTIRFVSRKGFQVKINGQRLGMEEIVHHLRAYLGRSIDVLSEVHCQRALDQMCEAAFWLAAHPYHLLSESGNSFMAN
ncbi:hypothetical protein N7471_000357 [Penicillium samsonianum]|uniref:uncharacterized protein n=1 Tax=Penicillium samsonianum TaxID=1882272 RepID=UPI0025488C60|nr:uncharacterized protein N7471_000357 [Penicillium samsonianum]KAJ6149158.1 hypothetical protein N7471_000357 [Penicillium samsonianum]